MEKKKKKQSNNTCTNVAHSNVAHVTFTKSWLVNLIQEGQTEQNQSMIFFFICLFAFLLKGYRRAYSLTENLCCCAAMLLWCHCFAFVVDIHLASRASIFQKSKENTCCKKLHVWNKLWISLREVRKKKWLGEKTDYLSTAIVTLFYFIWVRQQCQHIISFFLHFGRGQ